MQNDNKTFGISKRLNFATPLKEISKHGEQIGKGKFTK
jgi:hypothetical protein